MIEWLRIRAVNADDAGGGMETEEVVETEVQWREKKGRTRKRGLNFRKSNGNSRCCRSERGYTRTRSSVLAVTSPIHE